MAERATERHRPAEVIPLPPRPRRGSWRSRLPGGLVLATLAFLAAGLLASWALIVAAGEPRQVGWWVGTLPLAAWVAVPFLFMALVSRWLSAVRRAAWANLVAAALLPAICVAGALQLLLGSGRGLPRSYFVFAPVVMAFAYLPFLAAAIWLHRRMLEGSSEG
jgi:uncharacterized BrkB/YihY/UPF0761 family membrane protein